MNIFNHSKRVWSQKSPCISLLYKKQFIFKRCMGVSSNRGTPMDIVYLDPYIPPAKYIYTWDQIKKRTKKWMSKVLISLIMRYDDRSWKPKAFAIDCQTKYISLNKGVASGNLDKLDFIAPPYLVQLTKQIKSTKKIGDYKWEYHGESESPKLIHISKAMVPIQGEKDKSIYEAVVKVNLKQAVSIKKGSQVIGGDPNNIQSVIEYIVWEKWGEDPWKIKGKATQKDTIE
ncbi:hypothetical protein BC833DRAFT_609897 [Globomyces pollinis-pini]|nr:hypothetical protein BC833DRAFT_609897 [Globomyces pollinis-pini]